MHAEVSGIAKQYFLSHPELSQAEIPKFGIAQRVGIDPRVPQRGKRGAMLHALMLEAAAFKGVKYMIGQYASNPLNTVRDFHFKMGWEEMKDEEGESLKRYVPVNVEGKPISLELTLIVLKVPSLEEAQQKVRDLSVSNFTSFNPFRSTKEEAPAPASPVTGIKPRIPA